MNLGFFRRLLTHVSRVAVKLKEIRENVCKVMLFNPKSINIENTKRALCA